MKFYFWVSAILFAALMVPIPQLAFAESDGSDDLESVYDEYETSESKARQRQEKKKKDEPIDTLGDLATLSPFEDVAVIQRRFLPRTGRFELTLSGMSLLNNVFFQNFGGNIDFAYFWSDRFGVEVSYSIGSESERDTTNRLKEKGIETESLVVPKSYTGIALRWTPIYGKMALFNNKIVPFDIYFAPGLGVSKTDNGDASTIHLETGQVFAFSKSMALRWDFSWNFYQVTTQETVSGVVRDVKKNQSDLYLGLGVSFFFPEAKYR